MKLLHLGLHSRVCVSFCCGSSPSVSRKSKGNQGKPTNVGCSPISRVARIVIAEPVGSGFPWEGLSQYPRVGGLPVHNEIGASFEHGFPGSKENDVLGEPSDSLWKRAKQIP